MKDGKHPNPNTIHPIAGYDTVIFEELCVGTINEASRKKLQGMIEKLKEKGAEGVILGCTELGLLIRQSDVSAPLFDTTVIHEKRAAQIAAEDRSR